MSKFVVVSHFIVILNEVKDLVPTSRRDALLRFARFFAIAQNDKKTLKNLHSSLNNSSVVLKNPYFVDYSPLTLINISLIIFLMKSRLLLDGLADLLINLAAGYFGLVLFSPFFKAGLSVILVNILNGLMFFLLAIYIKGYEFN